MKKIILKTFPIIILIIISSFVISCNDEKENNHANTPRSEPGEGYKTPGPSAGDTAVHKCK
jgi:hypothetical protein